MPRGVETVEFREWGEQAGLLLGREAGTVVAHPEAHHPVRLHRRAQFHARRPAAVLDGVAEVVDPHLFNPRAVTQCHRPGFGQDDLSLVFLDHIGQPPLGFDNEPCRVQWLHRHFRRARFGQQQ